MDAKSCATPSVSNPSIWERERESEQERARERREREKRVTHWCEGHGFVTSLTRWCVHVHKYVCILNVFLCHEVFITHPYVRTRVLLQPHAYTRTHTCTRTHTHVNSENTKQNNSENTKQNTNKNKNDHPIIYWLLADEPMYVYI